MGRNTATAIRSASTGERHHGTEASQPILVLGMHRSGTSALARVLEMMGAYLGKHEDLLPAHPQDNPTGYWERVDLLIEHDKFLKAAGFEWDRIAGFDPSQASPAEQERLRQTISRVASKLEYPGASWLVKDPRLCLLLPQWFEVIGDAACIVVVRDPREVAASMRESHRGVYTSHFLLALWEKYLRTALLDLKGHEVLFVSYEGLLAEPVAQTRRLCTALNAMGVAALHTVGESELRGFLDPQLRRSTAKSHIELSSQQATLLAWLIKQCNAPGAVDVASFPDAAAPDETLTEFQKALDDAARGRNNALGESTQWQAQVEFAIESAQAQLAHELSESRSQIQQAHAESGHLMTLLSEREQLVHSLEIERARLEQSSTQQLREGEQLHDRIASLVTAHEHHEQLLSKLAIELEYQRQNSEAARSEIAHWQQRVNELSGELAQRRHDDEHAQAEHETLQRKYDKVAREIVHLRHEREHQKQRMEELSAELQSHQLAAEELQRSNWQHESVIRELSAAMEQHWAAAERLSAHSKGLESSIAALRSSLSWKITAPLRVVGKIARPREWNLEQGLYRLYYALPGISPTRKRAFILWLHEHAGWLTRRTFSYRLNEQAKTIEEARVKDPVEQARMQRMDNRRAEEAIAQMKSHPVFSVVMPVFNVEQRWLMAAVASVRKQFYPHWELCIADDASTRPETREALKEIERLGDSRIKIDRLKKNLGIAGASNAALALATGDFVGLLDNDDELTADALFEAALAINADDPDFIYSDEDKLDEAGKHVDVHCKPDYSPDYFFSVNYLCHFAVLRRSLLDEIGGFRAGFEGAQDYDLFLRATERTSKILHIPKVLYHWRKIAGSTASTAAAKPKTTKAGLRALSESMQRRNIAGVVENGPFPNTFRVRRTIQGNPLVSIIIPFRDKAALLDACVSSILKKTRYPNFEVICIDNASTEPETKALLDRLQRDDKRIRIERYDAPFNYSAINNFGVERSKGEHLLFLNNDTEVISAEWLEAMLEHSQRPEVGVVGARLLYADDTIQHAGVIIGPGGVAGHGHLFQHADDPGYFGRIRLMQNLSAITFACAMTRREVFEELGGLNEKELKIAFNDVDYCLRAREAEYLIVYTPFATLHHYESKSRGYEDTPEKQSRFNSEVIYMQRRHAAVIQRGDPYYNPRLSLNNSFHPDPNYVYELPR